MISYPFTAKPILDEFGDPVLDVNGFPTYDRVIDSSMERAFNKQKWTNGVYAYPSDGLQVVAKTGMTVTIKRGGCQIEGAQGYNQTDIDQTCSPSNSSLARIDRFVARFDLNDSIRNIEIYKKEGTFSSTPVAPTITQEPNYYELVLADITIRKGATEINNADIKDQRLNSELCGVVIPAIPTPLDTSTLYNQYQDSLDQYLSFVASAINETLAGELQTNIDAVQDNVDDSNGKIQLVQKYNVVTAVTNGDFKCTLTGLSTLTSGDVVKVSFPSATDKTKVVRLSVDNGATYKNIYMGENLLASAVEYKDIELKYNGTQFEPMCEISDANVNGRWTKSPSGKMVCSSYYVSTTTDADGRLMYYYPKESISVNEISVVPSVVATQSGSQSVILSSSPTVSSVKLQFTTSGGTPLRETSVRYCVQVIGRWK